MHSCINVTAPAHYFLDVTKEEKSDDEVDDDEDDVCGSRMVCSLTSMPY